MKKNNLIRTIAALTLFSGALCAQAQKVKAPSGGKKISNELIGIFFEDISSSADGGLCAELIQNGGFEYSQVERNDWSSGSFWSMLRPGHSAGLIETRTDSPLTEQTPHYMRVYAEKVGHYSDFDGWTGVGIENMGYDGIPLKAGAKYDFSLFMRGDAMKIRVAQIGRASCRERV